MQRRSHRIWLSYLTLALVMVGAAAHGLLPQTTQRLHRVGIAFSEGTSIGDAGTLPTMRNARQTSDSRLSRQAQRGKVDGGDTLLLTVVSAAPAGPSSSTLRPDLGRRVSTATDTTHRPRGPPAVA